jgi:hypothetical protein
MKRCPTCKRTFEDDTLSFCLDDGTPLVAAVRPDSEETLVLPSSSDRSARVPDNQPSGRSTLPSDPWRPAMPPQYATTSPQRSVWPWLLAIAAVLLLGFGVIVAVAVIGPQLIHSKESKGVGPTPGWSPLPSPEPARSSTNESDVPTDADEVKSQLEDLEDEWERANAEADKEALDKILATEYAGDSNATKKNYLQTIQPNPDRRWSYSNFVLTLAGEHATLQYHLDRIDGDTTKSYDYVDTFVWRDHRWQATSSHQVK